MPDIGLCRINCKTIRRRCIQYDRVRHSELQNRIRVTPRLLMR
jgi:hypothetical protein